MRILLLIFYTIIVISGLIFAFLNAQPVMIHYYFGFYELPLSIALLGLLLIGVLFGFGGGYLSVIKLKLANRKLRRQLESIEKEVSQLRLLSLKEQ